MKLISFVKAAVTTRKAAEFYGLKVDHHGKTRCPFHPDKTPPMVIDDRHDYFGCHETGNVIDFTAKQLDLSTYESAKKLAADQYPGWFDGKYIDKVAFTRVFLEAHPMRCIGGQLFALDGAVENEALIHRQVTAQLQAVITSGLAKRSLSLLGYLRLAAYSEPLPLRMNKLHFKNGILHLGGQIEPTLQFYNNRLQVAYEPDAPESTRWLAFVQEILEADDDLTLQEHMGYCLIPSTKAQK